MLFGSLPSFKVETTNVLRHSYGLLYGNKPLMPQVFLFGQTIERQFLGVFLAPSTCTARNTTVLRDLMCYNFLYSNKAKFINKIHLLQEICLKFLTLLSHTQAPAGRIHQQNLLRLEHRHYLYSNVQYMLLS